MTLILNFSNYFLPCFLLKTSFVQKSDLVTANSSLSQQTSLKSFQAVFLRLFDSSRVLNITMYVKSQISDLFLSFLHLRVLSPIS